MESYYRVGYVSLTSIAYRLGHQLFPSLVDWLAFSQAQGEHANCQIDLDPEISHFCTIIQSCAFSCKIKKNDFIVLKSICVNYIYIISITRLTVPFREKKMVLYLLQFHYIKYDKFCT